MKTVGFWRLESISEENFFVKFFLVSIPCPHHGKGELGLTLPQAQKQACQWTTQSFCDPMTVAFCLAPHWVNLIRLREGLS